jgi:hypothetical protein
MRTLRGNQIKTVEYLYDDIGYFEASNMKFNQTKSRQNVGFNSAAQ